MLEIDPFSFGEEAKRSHFRVVIVVADGENASGPLLESPEHAECSLALCLKTIGKTIVKLLVQEISFQVKFCVYSSMKTCKRKMAIIDKIRLYKKKTFT